MSDFRKILVVQTAFAGDVILTLPLIQMLKRHLSPQTIDVVVVPHAVGLLAGHPAVSIVISYDKRGAGSGLQRLISLAGTLRRNEYQLAVVPHRSLRSAGLVWLARIPRRIGFNTSSGRWLFTDVAAYDPDQHEVVRNARLLEPLGISTKEKELPCLYPSEEDRSVVERFLATNRIGHGNELVALAPGTVWNTKRWLPERFAEVGRRLVHDGFDVVLIGGKGDAALCGAVRQEMASPNVASAAGQLSLLQSAYLIQRARLLLSNDSAPMHLAVAVRTPVAAVFGATVPEFGFAPCGSHDAVIEVKGLSCRPCSVHGGDRCPITTFICMKQITVEQVYQRITHILESESPKVPPKAGAGRG